MSPLASLASLTVLWCGQGAPHASENPAAPPDKFAATRLDDVDRDFAFQGEYWGSVRAVDGTEVPFGLQVAALGDGEFSALGYQDGLPGNGWDRETMISWSGRRQEDLLTFDGRRGRIIIQGGAGLVIDAFGKAVGHLAQIRRASATLGAPPPPQAIVLFDGTSTGAFENGQFTADGWLDVGAVTKTLVEDFHLHLEFRLPYMPRARNQGRGNSGLYVQRRYEVQILDSFGLRPVIDGCAALYRQQVADLNMCFPPLQWQTYDVYFTAARWNHAGEKTADARITVYHNGVNVHDDRVVPRKTGAGQQESPEPAPILLQNHGDPVAFRNIWLVPGPMPATARPGEAAAADASAACHSPGPCEGLCGAQGDCRCSARPTGMHAVRGRTRCRYGQ